ncbi:acyl-CoA carboxylase subunit epsilon [Streptomyces sp. ACA25]|uniref:acyl-CoA carboxylase subunit epsilon n=1 Tax=Streptomyces sp. ACA25 TaxID=3022596 RepID=UPI0023082D37|nr:acyl-CoA carboxylase subunit epsilon [Streptomyces sp. ACA25]MDB1087029.1 acyl-CoA carboxylase subunit epsilon [Streptomyces sp. ACA25]
MIRVVRGNPTPEEIAAAVAVVQARVAVAASAGSPGGPRAASEWSDPARLVPRRVPVPGPHAWLTSSWPG